MDKFYISTSRCVRRICIALACGMLFLLLGGCANLPTASWTTLDAQLEKSLDTFCPIAAKPDAGPTPQERMIRARFVLSAITGYAVLSMEHYSGASDFKDDATHALDAVHEAYTTLDLAESKADTFIYPIYRTDMVIELAHGAEAALRPILRSGRGIVTASGIGRVDTLKTMFISLLQDEIYRDAYHQSCKSLAEANAKAGANPAEYLKNAKSQLSERTKANCDKLADLAKSGSVCSWFK